MLNVKTKKVLFPLTTVLGIYYNSTIAEQSAVSNVAAPQEKFLNIKEIKSSFTQTINKNITGTPLSVKASINFNLFNNKVMFEDKIGINLKDFKINGYYHHYDLLHWLLCSEKKLNIWNYEITQEISPLRIKADRYRLSFFSVKKVINILDEFGVIKLEPIDWDILNISITWSDDFYTEDIENFKKANTKEKEEIKKKEGSNNFNKWFKKNFTKGETLAFDVDIYKRELKFNCCDMNVIFSHKYHLVKKKWKEKDIAKPVKNISCKIYLKYTHRCFTTNLNLLLYFGNVSQSSYNINFDKIPKGNIIFNLPFKINTKFNFLEGKKLSLSSGCNLVLHDIYAIINADVFLSTKKEKLDTEGIGLECSIGYDVYLNFSLENCKFISFNIGVADKDKSTIEEKEENPVEEKEETPVEEKEENPVEAKEGKYLIPAKIMGKLKHVWNKILPSPYVSINIDWLKLNSK